MDDLISRQAAIDFIAAGHLVNPNEPRWSDNEVVNFLKSRPSAQRTGRWIDGKVKHIKNGEMRNVRECSECGSSYFVYDYYNSVDEIPKFCPHCGAKMEVEE